jgi:hypothetical protein
VHFAVGLGFPPAPFVKGFFLFIQSSRIGHVRSFSMCLGILI